MKEVSASPISRNSEPVYNATLPSRASLLPSTDRRVVAGIETSRDYTRTDQGLFGRETRHYNLVTRMVSAPALTLSKYSRAELEGAILLACGGGGVDVHEGIPTIAREHCFRVVRSADLFFGGTITELSPGTYTAGDTVIDQKSGRVYLELAQNGETHVAVIGLFMPGRRPSCVDWRVIEPTS